MWFLVKKMEKAGHMVNLGRTCGSNVVDRDLTVRVGGRQTTVTRS